MKSSLKKVFTFATYIEKLKKLERYKGQFYWKDYPFPKRYESVADHTWRLVLLIICIKDELSKEIDLEKALKMAIIHDIAEIIAGDESPLGNDGTGKNSHAFNEEIKKKIFLKEKAAAIKIFSKLPKKIGKEFLDLWLEFEEQKSYEAKVVKSLDRLEAVLQVLEYSKGSLFATHLEFNKAYGLKGSDADPATQELGQIIIAKMQKKFKEFKK